MKISPIVTISECFTNANDSFLMALLCIYRGSQACRPKLPLTPSAILQQPTDVFSESNPIIPYTQLLLAFVQRGGGSIKTSHLGNSGLSDLHAQRRFFVEADSTLEHGKPLFPSLSILRMYT